MLAQQEIMMLVLQGIIMLTTLTKKNYSKL